MVDASDGSRFSDFLPSFDIRVLFPAPAFGCEQL